jgi:hypothetical protein
MHQLDANKATIFKKIRNEAELLSPQKEAKAGRRCVAAILGLGFYLLNGHEACQNSSR